jgi:GT2 family glycosyltransferase
METCEKVTIVIVSYNSYNVLVDCIESIPFNENYEIIVVDNSPNNNTVEKLKKYEHLKIIRNKKNIGFSAACNVAVQRAVGEYILLLNPDCRVINDSIQKLVEFLNRNPNVHAVGPLLLDEANNPTFSTGVNWNLRYIIKRHVLPARIANYYGIQKVKRLCRDKNPKEVEWLLGACVMLRKNIWQRIGGLDNRFFLSADDLVDYCRRAKKQFGKSVYFIPDVWMYHISEKSYKSLKSFALINVYNGHLLLLKKESYFKYAFAWLFLVIFSIVKMVLLFLYSQLLRRKRNNYKVFMSVIKWLFYGNAGNVDYKLMMRC